MNAKKAIKFLVILSSMQVGLYGQEKTVSGTITKNTTWEGTVLVSGDILISKSVTLTIAPGTNVRFSPNSDNQRGGKDINRGEIVVEGILIANAARQAPIRFTSNSKEPQAGDWYGILVKNAKPGEVSLLDNCIIEYAYDGIICFSSSPNIFNCRIQICYNNGLTAEVRANPFLKNNNINNNGYAGVFCNLGSSPYLSRNTITENKYGMFITNMSKPVLGISGSTKENEKGENRVYANTDANIYNQSQAQIQAQNNDWGTLNSVQIDQLVYDQNDNRASGIVTYLPILAVQAAQQIARQQQQERRQVAQLERQSESGAAAITPVSQTVRPTQRPTPSTITKLESKSPPGSTREIKSEGKKSVSEPIKQESETPEVVKTEPMKTEPVKTEPPPVLTIPPVITEAQPPSITEISKSEPPKIEGKKVEPSTSKEDAEQYEPIRSMDELDTAPEFKKQVRPTFPASVPKSSVKGGSVTVYLIVNKEGDVEYSRVVRPIGNKQYDAFFNEAALIAAKEWKFKPGMVGGKRVKFNLITSIKFE